MTPGARQGAALRPARLSDEAWALPNLLTYLRLLAVPLFLWATATGHDALAFGLFLGAAVTDGLDGLLARVLDQRTRLGGMLDPVADKLLALAALAILCARGDLPAWLLALVAVKEGCTTLAVMVLRATGHALPAAPSRLGKYATFSLAAATALALAQRVWPSDGLRAFVAACVLISAQCVAVVIVQYFGRWRRLMRLPPSVPPSSRPLSPR